MPARCWCGVLVAVIEPTDHEVVPPGSGFFSSSTTLRPSRAASDAAARPAPPPPTTTTSKVVSVLCGTNQILMNSHRTYPSRARPQDRPQAAACLSNRGILRRPGPYLAETRGQSGGLAREIPGLRKLRLREPAEQAAAIGDAGIHAHRLIGRPCACLDRRVHRLAEIALEH